MIDTEFKNDGMNRLPLKSYGMLYADNSCLSTSKGCPALVMLTLMEVLAIEMWPEGYSCALYAPSCPSHCPLFSTWIPHVLGGTL